jgi:pilus assembly protein Flp/PilA
MDQRRRLAKLLRDQRGATAVEYGLICAMIILAMLVALRGVASANTNMWGYVSNEVLNGAH